MDKATGQNGRVPVLEAEIRFIRETLSRIEAGIEGFVSRVSKNERDIQNLAQCDALQARDLEGINTRLQTVEETVKQLGKNPWVAGLGSGGTVLLLGQVVRWLVDFAKSGGFTP